jgi:hypothetical protein
MKYEEQAEMLNKKHRDRYTCSEQNRYSETAKDEKGRIL